MAEQINQQQTEHRLVLVDRKEMLITGVQSVLAYDETSASMQTTKGRLYIAGNQLAVSELSVQTGQVKISGEIEYMQYQQEQDKNVPLWKRLMR